MKEMYSDSSSVSFALFDATVDLLNKGMDFVSLTLEILFYVIFRKGPRLVSISCSRQLCARPHRQVQDSGSGMNKAEVRVHQLPWVVYASGTPHSWMR